MKTSINDIDEVIHRERMDSQKKEIMHLSRFSDLPEGTFIQMHDEAYVFNTGQLHRWTPFGYEEGIDIPGDTSRLTILTPHSIVNAFKEGYVPQTGQTL
jgi:hypothetical protein